MNEATGILCWIAENSTPHSSKALPGACVDEAQQNEDSKQHNDCNLLHRVLSPADLFALSDEAAAAGSPCVVVKDGLLGKEDALRAYEAALEVENGREMKPAGMGRGNSVWHGQESRGDSILWITEGIQGTAQLPEPLVNLLQRLEALKAELDGEGRKAAGSSKTGLNLVDMTSVQLARYPGDGRGYVRHRDTPQSAQDNEEADRKITMVYYLNPDWDASMGGQLRIHVGSDGSERGKWDVEPFLDRLVMFRSDLVDHEVLPAFAPRLAVTLWLYGRQLGLPSRPPIRSSLNREKQPSSPKQLKPGNDTRDKVRPLPWSHGDDGGDATEASIFVSVVSYRDSEANPTIADLFARASNPSRVSVGLVWQLDLTDAGDEESYRATPNGEELKGGRLRSVVMPARDAAGPSWARRVAQSLWKGERFVLQIDSHTRFRPGWDSYLIQTLHRCPSTKPILTTYPAGYELPHKIPAGETRPTLLVPDSFGPEGMLRQTGRLLLRTMAEPLPSPLWASGFSFSASSLLVEVPYDPGLRHSFFGEEVSMAARMFTKGWDFYAPPQTVVYHLWSRSHRPSFRQVSTRESELEEAGAKRRLRRLLGVSTPASAHGDPTSIAAGTTQGAEDGEGSREPQGHRSSLNDDDDRFLAGVGDQYGLGTVRTLQSFADRVDVDFCAATITSPDARNGGLLATDFNDSVASGLEGLLGILKAEMGRKSGFGGKCEDDESVDDHVIDDGGDDGGV